MRTKPLSPTTKQIQGRFFEAIDMLIAQKKDQGIADLL